MPDYLVFQLYGPISAWGDIAVGETRRSASHPSKSAILGLVAAALGIDRTDETTHRAMVFVYGFAVKVLSFGTLLVDYHTVQVPAQRRNAIFRTRKDELSESKLGTILSSREYRCDSAYIAALWIQNQPAPFSLLEIENAIIAPKYTPYLGRKSCAMGLPMAPKVGAFPTLKKALDSRENFEKEMSPISRNQPHLYYWDDNIESGLKSEQEIDRWDLPRSRSRWQFSPRLEKMCVIKKEA
jgi:CRISPR system Cascade subunit CasD